MTECNHTCSLEQENHMYDIPRTYIHTYMCTYDEPMPPALCLGTPVLRQKRHIKCSKETILRAIIGPGQASETEWMYPWSIVSLLHHVYLLLEANISVDHLMPLCITAISYRACACKRATRWGWCHGIQVGMSSCAYRLRPLSFAWGSQTSFMITCDSQWW